MHLVSMEVITLRQLVQFRRESRPARVALRVWLERLAACVRRGVCAVKGHDMMLAFEPDRLSLRCAACGLNTTGWRLDVRFPPVPPLRARVVAREAPPVVTPGRQAPHRPYRAKAA